MGARAGPEPVPDFGSTWQAQQRVALRPVNRVVDEGAVLGARGGEFPAKNDRLIAPQRMGGQWASGGGVGFQAPARG